MAAIRTSCNFLKNQAVMEMVTMSKLTVNAYITLLYNEQLLIYVSVDLKCY